MEIITSWLKPPPQTTGLDHLAVQAPGIKIYGKLLPGITNVTDRARYYSFYPWLIWALEQQGYVAYDDTFVERFRRADILFTLIAERHAHIAGGESEPHTAALIGRNNLHKLVLRILAGETVKLSEYARQHGTPRYFKNKLGGLGQYYLGALSEMNVLDGSVRSGIQYTRQRGLELAQAMDRCVPRTLFMQTLEEDSVAPERFDQLNQFCSCQLVHSPGERKLLCDLFFAQEPFYDEEALPRRRTLQLLLFLADALAEEDAALDITLFRGSVYGAALPGGKPWIVPDRLQLNKENWSMYQRHELLSIALQGIFFVVLAATEEHYHATGRRFQSGADLCDWFVAESDDVHHLASRFDFSQDFRQLVTETGNWLPACEQWDDREHEIQLANVIVHICRQRPLASDRAEILRAALHILLALKVRKETEREYGKMVFPERYFDVYPLNLKKFLEWSENEWPELSAKAWLRWLCLHWGIENHLRVALRKLQGQSQSTFRLRPSDRGLEILDVPVAVNTSPRFHQALRILLDVGALVRQDDGLVTSDLGKQLKEVHRDV